MSDQQGIMKVEHGPGNFGECLVEGSAEENKRGRKSKRRAIAISIALQSLGLAALVIAPMLAKPAEIKTTTEMPIPPYSAPRQPHVRTVRMIDHSLRACVFCPTAPIAPINRGFSRVETTSRETEAPPIEGALPSTGVGLIKAFDRRSAPRQPDPPAQEVRRIHRTSVDPALLVNRVEPVFPPLARQIRKSGRVELHAVIATDGTIQSLQVVSGDPLFVRSALDAVGQWRYKPMLLNGQAVEIDTFITVIYTLNQ